jgi:hypothetical protein
LMQHGVCCFGTWSRGCVVPEDASSELVLVQVEGTQARKRRSMRCEIIVQQQRLPTTRHVKKRVIWSFAQPIGGLDILDSDGAVGPAWYADVLTSWDGRDSRGDGTPGARSQAAGTRQQLRWAKKAGKCEERHQTSAQNDAGCVSWGSVALAVAVAVAVAGRGHATATQHPHPPALKEQRASTGACAT